jgi:polygalacturonase
MKRTLCIAWLAASSLLLVGCSPSLVSGEAPLLPQDQISSINAPFSMPQPQRPAIPAARFDIRAYGAVEGGVVKNTDAIRRAIESASEQGGGNVIVPPGTWLTGAIHLDNHINLYISKGAELIFSQDSRDYLPVVFSRHEDVECYKYSAFIYADGKTDIAITGEGTLNGRGKPWWDWKTSKKNMEDLLYEMAGAGVPVEERVFDGSNGRELRPAFFQPMRCKNVLVEGVTFLYGAFWTITPTYCANVIVRRVHIVTEGSYGHTPNGDGVDPSSSRDVLIEHCQFDTGDDCVAIKAGRDRDGLRVAIPTENVIVRHCQGLQGHGGIVIGSETSGGIRNVYAVDCQFKGTDRIVRIKTARGRGGVIENLWFEDLKGEEIAREAIRVNMIYTGERLPAEPVSITTPTIRNVHYDSITCTSGKSYAIELLGLPERAIENVTFDRISTITARGVNFSDVKGIQLTNVSVSAPFQPLITIMDGRDVSFRSITVPQEAEQVLRVEGSRSANISISMNVPDGTRRVSMAPEVSKNAVAVHE